MSKSCFDMGHVFVWWEYQWDEDVPRTYYSPTFWEIVDIVTTTSTQTGQRAGVVRNETNYFYRCQRRNAYENPQGCFLAPGFYSKAVKDVPFDVFEKSQGRQNKHIIGKNAIPFHNGEWFEPHVAERAYNGFYQEIKGI